MMVSIMDSAYPARPWLAHIATVFAAFSVVCEGVFLNTVNNVQATEAKVFSIVESILDWFFLAGPSFALSLLALALCLLFCGLSYVKKEDASKQRIFLFVLCILQVLFFSAQID